MLLLRWKERISCRMETLDRAEEWRRLKELYRQMTDEELEVVAADAYDLTEIARQVLQAEIASRNLKFELQKPAYPQLEQEGIMNPTQQIWT